MVSELKLWSNESFPEKVKLLVMPRHKELFRDVEREKKKKERKLGSLPRKLSLSVYTFLKIQWLLKEKKIEQTSWLL